MEKPLTIANRPTAPIFWWGITREPHHAFADRRFGSDVLRWQSRRKIELCRVMVRNVQGNNSNHQRSQIRRHFCIVATDIRRPALDLWPAIAYDHAINCPSRPSRTLAFRHFLPGNLWNVR